MAYIAHSLKNGRGNTEARKFKVITKFYFNANLERFTIFGPRNFGAIRYICQAVGPMWQETLLRAPDPSASCEGLWTTTDEQ